VQLLSESYNPHVRYGAAMALGIACAGTGNKDALALIEPMKNDPVNYVRQVGTLNHSKILKSRKYIGSFIWGRIPATQGSSGPSVCTLS
jgi:hypothetical protein